MSVKSFPEFSKYVIRRALSLTEGRPQACRLMGIDWGAKRIGLAQCKLYPPGNGIQPTASVRTSEDEAEVYSAEAYKHFQSITWPYRILPVHLQGHNDPLTLESQYLQATRKIRRLIQNKSTDALVSNGIALKDVLRYVYYAACRL
eukprot:gb/GECG01013415.1/.p1 GENE.gb/GECG01013415.1/~~gb/GECG01013415.1/.p1  ORF type:complete len:146 (+),score=5.51 gb/GECG01013415.1/:1-438(+)